MSSPPMFEKNSYQSYYFSLTSSQEIDEVVDAIRKNAKGHLVVYLASYMHNTVLFHNLSTTLEKSFPNITLHLLPNNKTNPTELIVYTYEGTMLEELSYDENKTAIENLVFFDQVKNSLTIKQELLKTRSELVKRYFVDSLTQLPNHYQLRHDLDEADLSTFVVIHIDNFKLINDFYGFIVGDFLLEQLTVTLKALLGDVTLYKTSGAEFTILLPEYKEFYELEAYLEDLHKCCSTIQYEYSGNTVYVDLTFASSASNTLDDAFSKVSMALQYAKKMRLPYWIYEESMTFKDEYESNLKIATKIRQAIENSGIVPYFQPIVSNKTGEITKYECLARLIDSEGNIFAPNQFLHIAKTIKVYSQVTTTIIDKSFEVFKDNNYHFSINISIDDIMSHEIYTFIMEKLSSSKMGKRVTFELLETEHIHDYEKVTKFINEVRRLGAKVAIDDFGSGFANFSYLSKIKVHYLKIDGSLITNIDTDKGAEIVVETIVDFAKKLGIETIAEYVHSSSILAKVKHLGIDYSQGFYIDAPLPQIN